MQERLKYMYPCRLTHGKSWNKNLVLCCIQTVLLCNPHLLYCALCCNQLPCVWSHSDCLLGVVGVSCGLILMVTCVQPLRGWSMMYHGRSSLTRMHIVIALIQIITKITRFIVKCSKFINLYSKSFTTNWY